MTELPKPIIATIVPEEKRLAVLPRFFSFAQMLCAEALVFAYMTKLSIDYSGGYWHYYTLSNGGFYMAPAIDVPMKIEWNGNGYSGMMTADAAGIVATLFAVNHLADETDTDKMTELYHQLLHFACAHPEAKAILAAID